MNNPNVKIKDKRGGKNMRKGNNKPNNKPQHYSTREIEIFSNNDRDVILDMNSDIKKFIELSETFANKIKDIPSSKIRDFYDYVVQIEEESKGKGYSNELYGKTLLLMPKMAYQSSKESNKYKRLALEILEREFTKILEQINFDKDKFESFKLFFEAVVAYHKKVGKN